MLAPLLTAMLKPVANILDSALPFGNRGQTRGLLVSLANKLVAANPLPAAPHKAQPLAGGGVIGRQVDYAHPMRAGLLRQLATGAPLGQRQMTLDVIRRLCAR